MRSDRNLYSKNLIESQDEITEMKRKLKIMNHQIDQLKEEIMAKEAALVKEHLEHQRVEKEKDALKAELQRMKQQAAESKAYIEQQEVEERKLLKIISEADAERLRQKKELDQVGLLQRDHYAAKGELSWGMGERRACLEGTLWEHSLSPCILWTQRSFFAFHFHFLFLRFCYASFD